MLKKSVRGSAGIVYVGITNQYRSRSLVHKRKKRLPDGFVSRQITGYIEPQEAAALEKLLIDRYQADKSRECANKKVGGSLGCGIRDNDWNAENIAIEAKKWTRRIDFNKASQSAYNAANRLGIFKEVTSHMTHKREIWTEERILACALQYDSIKAFIVSHKSAYSAATRMRVRDKACAHMRRKKQIWTKEKILNESKKYNSREEFKIKNNLAYQAARRHGLEEKAFSHMKPPLRKWTAERITDEAKKYSTRKEFRITNESAYKASKRLSIIDQVCSHMQSSHLGNIQNA